MAISGDTWRRAHGFSDQDAPTPTEVALRLLQERGAITPELTEAMLKAVAPEVMEAVQAVSQENSVAPMTPELQNLLDGALGESPAASTEAAPTEEPAPTPEEVQQ
jgi:hypothetical protein